MFHSSARSIASGSGLLAYSSVFGVDSSGSAKLSIAPKGKECHSNIHGIVQSIAIIGHCNIKAGI